MMKYAFGYLSALFLLWGTIDNGEAFSHQPRTAQPITAMVVAGAKIVHEDERSPSRRLALNQLATGALASLVVLPSGAQAEESIFAPKFIQEYPDFTQSTEGWSYKDVKGGNGDSPKPGDRIVFEWSGYTVGYFARPFEARGYVAKANSIPDCDVCDLEDVCVYFFIAQSFFLSTKTSLFYIVVRREVPLIKNRSMHVQS
jgi:hypothetical protein